MTISIFQHKLIAGLIALAMLFLANRPLLLACFYLIVRPLVEPFSYPPYSLSMPIPVTGIFGAILIAVAALNGLVKKDFKIARPNLLPLYLMLLLSSLSFMNSVDVGVSIAHFIKILSAVAAYLLVYNGIRKSDDAKKVLNAMMIASLLPMLFGYYQYITGTGQMHKGAFYEGSRIDSFLYEVNAYGEFLSVEICVVLSLIIVYAKRIRRRLVLSAVMISLIISFVLSLNRGSWIALTLGLVVAAAFYLKKISIRWVVIVGVGITLAFSAVVISRFAEMEQRTNFGSKNTLSQRVNTWKLLVPLTLQHPVAGQGIGTAALISEKYFGANALHAPHNDYLRLSLECGYFVALLYVIFLINEILFNLRRARLQRNWFINMPVFMMVIYFPVISAVQNIVYNVTVFPMMLAIIAVSRKWNEILDRENQSSSAHENKRALRIGR